MLQNILNIVNMMIESTLFDGLPGFPGSPLDSQDEADESNRVFFGSSSRFCHKYKRSSPPDVPHFRFSEIVDPLLPK